MKLKNETGRVMTDRTIIESLPISESGRFIEAAPTIRDKRIKKVRAVAGVKGYRESGAALRRFPGPLFKAKERLATVLSDSVA